MLIDFAVYRFAETVMASRQQKHIRQQQTICIPADVTINVNLNLHRLNQKP